jgi:hypothetical protein
MKKQVIRSYATPRFQVKIDGHPITSFVKSVEGGLVKTEATKEPTGPFNIPLQHLSTRTAEPITLEVGLSGADWTMDLLKRIINDREHVRIDGEVLHADVNSATRFWQEWKRGLVTEVGFPSFDGSSKDSAYLKIKIQPEIVNFEAFRSAGALLQPEKDTQQKLWNCNAFRLNLERNGSKINTEFVTKLEAFAIKVPAKAFQRGKFNQPLYFASKPPEFPPLSMSMPLHYAPDAINWYKESVTKEGQYEATGSIEILDPSRTKTLYTINLDGVGPTNFSITKADASTSNPKLCKVDMYVTSMLVKKQQQIGK